MSSCKSRFTQYPENIEKIIFENAASITKVEYPVFMLLMRYTIGYQRNTCKLSYADIEKEIHIPKKSIAIAIKRLIERGWIEAKRESQREKNTYTLKILDEKFSASIIEHKDCSTFDSSQNDYYQTRCITSDSTRFDYNDCSRFDYNEPSDTYLNNKENIQRNNFVVETNLKAQQSELETEFSRRYELCPSKTGASKITRQAKITAISIDFEKFAQAIENYKATWQKIRISNPNYQYHSSANFFNDQVYIDYLPENFEPSHEYPESENAAAYESLIYNMQPYPENTHPPLAEIPLQETKCEPKQEPEQLEKAATKQSADSNPVEQESRPTNFGESTYKNPFDFDSVECEPASLPLAESAPEKTDCILEQPNKTDAENFFNSIEPAPPNQQIKQQEPDAAIPTKEEITEYLTAKHNAKPNGAMQAVVNAVANELERVPSLDWKEKADENYSLWCCVT